jgi:hypothetical protein
MAIGTLPPELYEQQQQLNRQQQMAQLLMQQGMQQPQGQMVSGRFVAPSIFQNIAPLVQAYMGRQMAEQGDKKAIELANKLREGRNITEEAILNKLTGTPAVPEKITEMAGPYGQGVGEGGANVPMPTAYMPARAAVAPDLPGALREINTNQYGAGKDLKPTILKQMMPDIPTSVLEYQYAQKDPRYAEYQTGLKKAGTPSMTAITNVQAFEPFKSKVQGQMGEALVKNFETLQNIPTTIKTLDRAIELAPQSFAGSFGQQKLELTKFFNNNLGTNINPAKVSNTEELRSALFTNVIENLKKLDASPSQEQQRVLQQSMGTIATDPTALPKVINTYKQILIDKAETHNKKVEQAMSGSAKMDFPFDIRIPVSGGIPSPSDIDAEIERRRKK